ncbi:MAG: winged helix-turn-helix transcriptional regulator, partial [Candidatus Omnitrophota bacterium]
GSYKYLRNKILAILGNTDILKTGLSMFIRQNIHSEIIWDIDSIAAYIKQFESGYKEKAAGFGGVQPEFSRDNYYTDYQDFGGLSRRARIHHSQSQIVDPLGIDRWGSMSLRYRNGNANVRSSSTGTALLLPGAEEKLTFSREEIIILRAYTSSYEELSRENSILIRRVEAYVSSIILKLKAAGLKDIDTLEEARNKYFQAIELELLKEGYSEIIAYAAARSADPVTIAKQINPFQEEVLEVIKKHPGLTQVAVSKQINMFQKKASERRVRRHIDYLENKDLIEVKDVGGKSRVYLKRDAPKGISSNQRKILRLVRREPGLTIKEISIKTGIPESTVQINVARLEKKGLVDTRSVGQYRHVYPKGKVPGNVLSIREKILNIVRQYPGLTQAQIPGKLNRDIAASVVSRNLAVLEKDGLIKRVTEGNKKKVYPAVSDTSMPAKGCSADSNGLGQDLASRSKAHAFYKYAHTEITGLDNDFFGLSGINPRRMRRYDSRSAALNVDTPEETELKVKTALCEFLKDRKLKWIESLNAAMQSEYSREAIRKIYKAEPLTVMQVLETARTRELRRFIQDSIPDIRLVRTRTTSPETKQLINYLITGKNRPEDARIMLTDRGYAWNLYSVNGEKVINYVTWLLRNKEVIREATEFDEFRRGVIYWMVDEGGNKLFPIVSYVLFDRILLSGVFKGIPFDLRNFKIKNLPRTVSLDTMHLIYYLATGESRPEDITVGVNYCGHTGGMYNLGAKRNQVKVYISKIKEIQDRGIIREATQFSNG